MATDASSQHAVGSLDGISHAGSRKLESGTTDSMLEFRDALVLWLRWNEAYERVTANMFCSGDDRRQLEALMDQMDQLRRRAIKLSHELLD
jgi:hypothetical protein